MPLAYARSSRRGSPISIGFAERADLFIHERFRHGNDVKPFAQHTNYRPDAFILPLSGMIQVPG